MKFTNEEVTWLRAALDGKAVQWRSKDNGPEWPWSDAESFAKDAVILSQPWHYEVRIKPDVIIVNGIEVPAPEKTELPDGTTYWVADVGEEECCSSGIIWVGDKSDKRWLSYGIVHTSPKAAAAHGIAMRAHKPG